jgi:dephospho-CoA kinase
MHNSEELRTKLSQTFGENLIKDGVVDRKALGAFVFKNKVILIYIFKTFNFRKDSSS